jgi:hypothetical protein
MSWYLVTGGTLKILDDQGGVEAEGANALLIGNVIAVSFNWLPRPDIVKVDIPASRLDIHCTLAKGNKNALKPFFLQFGENGRFRPELFSAELVRIDDNNPGPGSIVQKLTWEKMRLVQTVFVDGDGAPVLHLVFHGSGFNHINGKTGAKLAPEAIQTPSFGHAG